MVPVPLIMVLNLFMSARNYSGLPFLNVAIFSSYISDTSDAGFQCILILVMLHSFTSSVAALIDGISGGSMCD